MDTNRFFANVLKPTSLSKAEKVERDFETNWIHIYFWYDGLE